MVFCYQVTASPDPPPSVVNTEEGIVGALMMVMQKRSKVIHSSGSQLLSTIFYFIKLYLYLTTNIH